jgi:general stress protein YciG
MSTKNRGFASMRREQQRAIASKGGRVAHRLGLAHKWNSEEARAAGRKGGLASQAAKRLARECKRSPSSDGQAA